MAIEQLKTVGVKPDKPRKTENPTSFWRITKFKELAASNMTTLQERRQMFVVVSRWLLGVAVGVPLGMYQWMYIIWGVYLPSCLLGLYAWDYISHLKHINDTKKELSLLAVKDDSYEQNFVAKRPDKFDIVSPYVLFSVFFILIVAAYATMDSYNKRYGDSTIMNSIAKSKATVKGNNVVVTTE